MIETFRVRGHFYCVGSQYCYMIILEEDAELVQPWDSAGGPLFSTAVMRRQVRNFIYNPRFPQYLLF